MIVLFYAIKSLENHLKNIEEVLSVGDEVEAQVTGIRTDREKRSEDVPGVIYLSHKILENAEYRKLMELSWLN